MPISIEIPKLRSAGLLSAHLLHEAEPRREIMEDLQKAVLVCLSNATSGPIGVVRWFGASSRRSAPSDSGAWGGGTWVVLDGEAPWRSPPYARVFFLSNNAFYRQVSHSKEGRSSLSKRYTFLDLETQDPFFSLTHILDLLFPFHPSPTHTHLSQWPPHYLPLTASTMAPMALTELPRSLSRLVLPAC